MSDIREAAMNFEAVKISMSQDRNGVVLRLNVHPSECPPALHTDWVGSRYMVAMVKLDDEDQPDKRDDETALQRLISSAGLLCRNEEFGAYMKAMGHIDEDTDAFTMEDEVTKALYLICNIKSRSELRQNVSARETFMELREEFLSWKRKKNSI